MGGGNIEYRLVDVVLNDINAKFKDLKFSILENEKSNLEKSIKDFAAYLHNINFATELTDNHEPIKPKNEMDKILRVLGINLDRVIPNFKRRPVFNPARLTPEEQQEKELDEQTGKYKQAIKSAYADGVMLAVNLSLKDQYPTSPPTAITSQQINASVRTYYDILKNKIFKNYTLTECGSDGGCAIHAYVAALRNYFAALPEGPEKASLKTKFDDWGISNTRTFDSTNQNTVKELTNTEMESFRKKMVHLLRTDIEANIQEGRSTLEQVYLTDVRNDTSQQRPNEMISFESYYESMKKTGTYLRDQELAVIAGQDKVNIHVIKDNGEISSIRPDKASSIDLTLHNHGACHFTAYIKNISPANESKESVLQDAKNMADEEARAEAKQNIAWVNEYIASSEPKSWFNRLKSSIISFFELILSPFKFIADLIGFKEKPLDTNRTVVVKDNFSYQDIATSEILRKSIPLQKLMNQLYNYCVTQYSDPRLSTNEKESLENWWSNIKDLLKENNFVGFCKALEEHMDKKSPRRPQLQDVAANGPLTYSYDSSGKIETESLDTDSRILMEKYKPVLKNRI